jgi:hypothetical protein
MTPLLLDTSAWVEYLRDSRSPVCERVDELIRSDSVLATTDIVIMELLAGARDLDDRKKIWALMNRCVMLPVRPLFEYEKAADLYVRCRAAGFTPANTNDLLVASVAIGKRVPLLEADADFERIASVSSLKLVA